MLVDQSRSLATMEMEMEDYMVGAHMVEEEAHTVEVEVEAEAVVEEIFFPDFSGTPPCPARFIALYSLGHLFYCWPMLG